MIKLLDNNCSYDTATIKLMYRIGLLLIVPLIIGFFFLHTDFAKQFLLLNGRACAIKKMTGLPCPGCGGTRAAFMLAYFHIIISIKYNASVFAGALFYSIFMIAETFHFRLNTKGFSEKGFFAMFYMWVAVIIIHWIIKLLLMS